MTRTELIIQLLKVAIAIAFGAYFVWWSLQVLDRLTPEYEAAGAMIGLFSCAVIAFDISSSSAAPCRRAKGDTIMPYNPVPHPASSTSRRGPSRP